MNRLNVKVLDMDGASRLTEISIGTLTAQSMSYLPHIRTVSEMRLILQLRGRYDLDGIEGIVIDLPIAQRAFDVVSPPDMVNRQQQTFEGRVLRDPFTEFKKKSLIVVNPRMELLYEYQARADEALRKVFGQIEGVIDYLDRYDMEVASTDDDKQSHRQSIRRRLHAELFFTDSDVGLKKRDDMLGGIMKLQAAMKLPILIPACPMIGASVHEQECAEDINDKCQGIAYGLGFECASYFMYSKKALKDKDITGRYFEYIEQNKSRLNVLNFFELDLHQLDKRARLEFAAFVKRIVEFKHEHEGVEFMLLGAGNQSLIALESFDFVSTSLTGIDKTVGWSDKRTLGYWWDEHLGWAAAPEDRGEIDKNHCPACAIMTEADFTNAAKLNRRRREHRAFEMSKKATDFREALAAKKVGAFLRRELMSSDFSGYCMLIQSP